jgi:hypothetical protein
LRITNRNVRTGLWLAIDGPEFMPLSQSRCQSNSFRSWLAPTYGKIPVNLLPMSQKMGVRFIGAFAL